MTLSKKFKDDLVPQLFFIDTQSALCRTKTGRNCTVRLGKLGYYSTSERVKGKCITFYVHRVIAILAVPKLKGLDIVNHLNGDKKDNRPGNLEWTTYRGNAIHAIKTGLRPKGENHPNSIVSNKILHDVWALRLKNPFMPAPRIANIVGCNSHTVRTILNKTRRRSESIAYPDYKTYKKLTAKEINLVLTSPIEQSMAKWGISKSMVYSIRRNPLEYCIEPDIKGLSIF